MKITTIGVDLAKTVFQVHGVDERGKAVLRKQLRREQMVEVFAKRPSVLRSIATSTTTAASSTGCSSRSKPVGSSSDRHQH